MRIRDIRAELKLRGLRTGGYHEEIMDRLTKAVEQEEFEWLNPPPPDAVSEMRLWLEGYLPDEKSYLAPPAVQVRSGVVFGCRDSSTYAASLFGLSYLCALFVVARLHE